MKPPSIDKFLHLWQKVESKSLLIDTNQSHFCEWRDDYGIKYKGLRHKVSGEPHGFVRLITRDNDLVLASFKHGEYHGLKLMIRANEVTVSLCENFTMLAVVEFNSDFIMTGWEGDRSTVK